MSTQTVKLSLECGQCRTPDRGLQRLRIAPSPCRFGRERNQRLNLTCRRPPLRARRKQAQYRYIPLHGLSEIQEAGTTLPLELASLPFEAEHPLPQVRACPRIPAATIANTAQRRASRCTTISQALISIGPTGKSIREAEAPVKRETYRQNPMHVGMKTTTHSAVTAAVMIVEQTLSIGMYLESIAEKKLQTPCLDIFLFLVRRTRT